MAQLAIFIDGAYFDFILRDQFSGARVDYTLLSQQILDAVARRTSSGVDLLRTYYYHCLPFQSNPPTAEEARRYASMRSFLTSLERRPRFQVRLGRLARHQDQETGKIDYVQKRVDVLLAVDLTQLSAKRHITDAAILAGDSDFLPSVEVAKTEGIRIWLFHGAHPHQDLWDAADERIRLTQALIESVSRRALPQLG